MHLIMQQIAVAIILNILYYIHLFRFGKFAKSVVQVLYSFSDYSFIISINLDGVKFL